MNRTSVLGLALFVPALLGQVPPADSPKSREESTAKAKREACHKIYLEEAKGYTIYRDASRREKLELKPEPVYVWTNPIRGGEQDGEVYVWTSRGRAEVVGTFFSFPATGPRGLHHELHALSTATLDVTRPGAHGWTPKKPGIEPVAIADAPAPAKSATARMSQMRTLARDFSAITEDDKGRTWDLRTLPQPLYRYASTDPDVLDGAVFAFVTSAGTDPEMLLVLEARKAAGASAPTWHYGLGRFTDMKLTARLKGKTVFEVPRIPWDSVPVVDGPYRTFGDRQIPAVEGEASAVSGSRREP